MIAADSNVHMFCAAYILPLVLGARVALGNIDKTLSIKHSTRNILFPFTRLDAKTSAMFGPIATIALLAGISGVLSNASGDLTNVSTKLAPGLWSCKADDLDNCTSLDAEIGSGDLTLDGALTGSPAMVKFRQAWLDMPSCEGGDYDYDSDPNAEHPAGLSAGVWSRASDTSLCTTFLKSYQEVVINDLLPSVHAYRSEPKGRSNEMCGASLEVEYMCNVLGSRQQIYLIFWT
jgi:hypothetical protein